MVLLEVWCLAKRLGRKGFVGDIYLEPSFLAAELGLVGDEWERKISIALDGAYESGLLEACEGGVVVRDWAQYQIDAGSTERVRRHRARKRDSGGLDVDETVTNSSKRSVTFRNDGTATVLSCTVSDPDLEGGGVGEGGHQDTGSVEDVAALRVMAADMLAVHCKELGQVAIQQSPAQVEEVLEAIRLVGEWPEEQRVEKLPSEVVSELLTWARSASEIDGNPYATWVKGRPTGVLKLSKLAGNWEWARDWENPTAIVGEPWVPEDESPAREWTEEEQKLRDQQFEEVYGPDWRAKLAREEEIEAAAKAEECKRQFGK